MAYPSVWEKPSNEGLKDIVEVTKNNGHCHRFVDAFVKEINVEGEEWYSIKKIEDNTSLYHFPKDTVSKITVDGTLYVDKVPQ